MKLTTGQLARAALVAALYIVLTILPPFNAISYGAVQFRLGEALTLLPFILDEAVVGLTVGCLVANLFSPFGLIDLVVGTSVTLMAALLTRSLRGTGKPWLGALPPIILNTTIIPLYVSVLMLPEATHLELRHGLVEGLFFIVKHLSTRVYAPVAVSVLAGESAVVLLAGLPVLAIVRRSMRPPEVRP